MAALSEEFAPTWPSLRWGPCTSPKAVVATVVVEVGVHDQLRRQSAAIVVVSGIACGGLQLTYNWCTRLPAEVIVMPDKRTERIALRATEADKSLICRAAEACDVNVSEYAVSRLVADARRVLADRSVFRLDDDAWAEWEAINDRPARDLPGLRALMSRPSAFKD